MNKTIIKCKIHSTGIRKTEHPTSFKEISIEINLHASNVSEDELVKIIKLSEDTYCPVWAMLKGNVEVKVSFNIVNQL